MGQGDRRVSSKEKETGVEEHSRKTDRIGEKSGSYGRKVVKRFTHVILVIVQF